MDTESRLLELKTQTKFLRETLDTDRRTNLRYNRIMTVALVVNLLLQILNFAFHFQL